MKYVLHSTRNTDLSDKQIQSKNGPSRETLPEGGWFKLEGMPGEDCVHFQ